MGTILIFKITTLKNSNVNIFVFSLIFLILSILDISWGQRAVEDERNKLRISFIFDISRSMLSVDEGKIINRLESAKKYD